MAFYLPQGQSLSALLEVLVPNMEAGSNLPTLAKKFSSDPDRPKHQTECAQQTTFEHKPKTRDAQPWFKSFHLGSSQKYWCACPCLREPEDNLSREATRKFRPRNKWLMPIIPALRQLKLENCHKLEANLGTKGILVSRVSGKWEAGTGSLGCKMQRGRQARSL